MRTTKFFNILKEFSTSDVNRFEKFLISPYFNSNENLIQLFKIYQQIYKNQSVSISKEEGWDLIHTGVLYDDLKFRKLNTDLLKYFLDFLTVEELNDRKDIFSQLLMEVAEKTNIPKLKSTAINLSKTSDKKINNTNSSYYLYNYHKEKILFYLNEGDLNTNTKQNIEDISENLDIFFIAEKLKYYCEVLSRELRSNITYNIRLINELIHIVETENLQRYLIIDIYYLIYKTISEPSNVTYYNRLKELIFKNYRSFTGKELQELCGALLNYSVAKINIGTAEFYDEFKQIFEFILNNDIALNETYLTPSKFGNFVTLSLRAGNYEFAEIFIQEFQHLLPESQRKEIVKFMLAQIYFYKKEHSKVISLLQQYENFDTITDLRAKTIYLATLLELKEYEAITSWTESFRVFLTRKKKELPANRIKMYQNFMSIVRMIVAFDTGEKIKLAKIKSELEKYSSNVINESWLLEKIAERE